MMMHSVSEMLRESFIHTILCAIVQTRLSFRNSLGQKQWLSLKKYFDILLFNVAQFLIIFRNDVVSNIWHRIKNNLMICWFSRLKFFRFLLFFLKTKEINDEFCIQSFLYNIIKRTQLISRFEGADLHHFYTYLYSILFHLLKCLV